MRAVYSILVLLLLLPGVGRSDSVDGTTFSTIAHDHRGNTVLAGTSFDFGFFITVAKNGRISTRVLEVPGRGIKTLKFTSRPVGWMSNSSGVYRTSDSGRSWVWDAAIFTGIPQRVKGPRAFFAVDDVNAWALVAWSSESDHGSILLRTKDGGASWEHRSLPDGTEEMKEIRFADSDNGFILVSEEIVGGRYRAYRTHDGAQTWEEILFDGKPVDWDDLEIINFPVALMTVGGKAYRTQDGGRTWREMKLSVDTQIYLEDIDFRTTREGWIFARTKFFKTTDGGRTWNSFRPKGLPNDIDDIRFIDSKLGWAIRHYSFSKSVYTTRDGGRSWQLFPRKWAHKIFVETCRRRFPVAPAEACK